MCRKKLVYRKRVYIGYLLVVLWMGVIFYFSSRSGNISAAQSSGFNKMIEGSMPVIHSVMENMATNGLKIFSIRKLAHIFLYMVLTVLLYIPTVEVFRKYKLSLFVITGVSISYAVFDEIHQLFVPGRSGQIQDVMIDGIGVIIGILIIVLSRRFIDVVCKRKDTIV